MISHWWLVEKSRAIVFARSSSLSSSNKILMSPFTHKVEKIELGIPAQHGNEKVHLQDKEHNC